MQFFDDYMPYRSVAFTHNDWRWWSNTYLIVPVKRDIPGVTDLADGLYWREDEMDEDGYEGCEYDRSGDAPIETLEQLLESQTPINYTDIPSLWVSYLDNDGQATVLAQCGDVYVNRMLLGIAEYVMAERLVGLGIDGPHDPISLWTDGGFQGKVMPVRVTSPDELMPMTWGTA